VHAVRGSREDDSAGNPICIRKINEPTQSAL
jgi:hypothetical protein